MDIHDEQDRQRINSPRIHEYSSANNHSDGLILDFADATFELILISFNQFEIEMSPSFVYSFRAAIR